MYVEFCKTKPFLSLHSDVIRVSIVLSVESQLIKLWRNDSGTTGKQKTFERDFWVFLYTLKMWRLALRHELTESLELKSVCENIAFVLNNKY